MKHGHTYKHKQTGEYSAWASMKDRCYNKNNLYYHRYGGRGITVCDRWLHSFENFLEDMGLKPEQGRKYSLNKINNDGNYEPNNCEWATMHTQVRNRGDNVFIIFKGESKILQDWAIQYNMTSANLQSRMKFSSDFEKCLTKPIKKYKPRIKNAI